MWHFYMTLIGIVQCVDFGFFLPFFSFFNQEIGSLSRLYCQTTWKSNESSLE